MKVYSSSSVRYVHLSWFWFLLFISQGLGRNSSMNHMLYEIKVDGNTSGTSHTIKAGQVEINPIGVGVSSPGESDNKGLTTRGNDGDGSSLFANHRNNQWLRRLPHPRGHKKVTKRSALTMDEAFEHVFNKADRGTYPDYDNEKPTVVSMGVFLIRINKVRLESQECQLIFALSESWKDERLQFEGSFHLELNHHLHYMIWRPDVVFLNDIKGHMYMKPTPNSLLHINNDGSVYAIFKLSTTLTCDMNLHDYPFDSQICTIVMEPYSNTNKSVTLDWHPIDCYYNGMERDHPEYRLVRVRFYRGNLDYPNIAGGIVRSCLRMEFYLEREYGYYLKQLYIPTGLVVIVSWFSFWLDVDAVPGRSFVGIMSIVTMSAQGEARASTGQTDYIRAIDYWVGTCLLFVFASIMEFVYVNVTARNEDWFVAHKRISRFLSITEVTSIPSYHKQAFMERFKGQSETILTSSEKAKRIDMLCRVLFPFMFVIFNLVYWTRYLYNKGQDYPEYTVCKQNEWFPPA